MFHCELLVSGDGRKSVLVGLGPHFIIDELRGRPTPIGLAESMMRSVRMLLTMDPGRDFTNPAVLREVVGEETVLFEELVMRKVKAILDELDEEGLEEAGSIFFVLN